MAYLIGWGSPFDADDHTYKVFGTGKGANYSGYSNALVDQYLTEARQSDDPAVRKAAYANFQTALAEDRHFIREELVRLELAAFVADGSGHRPGAPRGGHLLERHPVDFGKLVRGKGAENQPLLPRF